MRSFSGRPSHSQVPLRAAVTLVALLALAWSGPAFCSEIHDAAQAGKVAKVQALLKANPNLVFSKNSDGYTPLHSAAENGHKDVAELLLAQGADVNARDNEGMTPLLWATTEGHGDVVKLLLANKADVNANDDSGNTPLHFAAIGAYKDITELLLANKAEVNARDKSGATPLDDAIGVALQLCRRSDCPPWNVAKLLYQHGGREYVTFPPIKF